MSPTAEKILEDAVNLSTEERVQLINELLQTLDSKVDPEIEKVWVRESERRYLRYKNGESKGYTEDEARRYLDDHLK